MDIAAQKAKADAFRAMHAAPDMLVLCNTPDVVSAQVVVEAGYPAVASSSAGVAWMLGYADGEHITRADMLGIVHRIATAVDVPVTADMEAGYGSEPDAVAATVHETVNAGAVGINIEDGSRGDPPLLDFNLSVERIAAAREAADATGVGLVVNARTDGHLRGGTGEAAFAEAVRRANAYREAGADSLFVPGVKDAETIAALVKEIDGPVNILASAVSPPIPQLQELGVSRVSIGGLLSCAFAGLVRRAAEELKGPGTYGFADGAILHPEMNKLLG